MPYYIELECRISDQEQFTRLGLTQVFTRKHNGHAGRHLNGATAHRDTAIA